MTVAPARSDVAAKPRPALRQFLKFAIVGTIGFLVDASVLAILFHGFDVDPLVARVPSFLIAVLVTWRMNRSFTFREAGRYSAVSEFVRYLGVQTLGVLVNFAVFAASIHILPLAARFPVIGLVFGAGAGLVINYTLLRIVAFPGKSDRRSMGRSVGSPVIGEHSSDR